MAVTLSYFPGCSLKTSSKFYEASIRKVFDTFGIGLRELDDWSCCGASAAHTVDEGLAHALVARNLAIAEGEGLNFFAPCSACYARSKITNDTVRRDVLLQDEVNRVISPRACTGTVEVKNIIEVLDDYVGLESIPRNVKYDLSALRIVPYYGCVLTRLMRVKPYDDRENPKSMDWLLGALGTTLVNWPYKMECCGASKTVTHKQVTIRLSEKIMDKAIALGADAIVTPCPLCQMNLDLLPQLGRTKPGLPVLFLSEAFELGLYGKLVGTASHLIPMDGLLAKVKEK